MAQLHTVDHDRDTHSERESLGAGGSDHEDYNNEHIAGRSLQAHHVRDDEEHEAERAEELAENDKKIRANANQNATAADYRRQMSNAF